MEHTCSIECFDHAKRCTGCNVKKKACDFYPRPGQCKKCILAKNEAGRKARLATPEGRAKYNEYYRDRTASMSDDALLARQLKVYGLTLEDYQRMLKEQDGKCAICPTQLILLDGNEGRNQKRLHVDHDHKTNKVRGLLCPNCNLMLGHAKDDMSILLSAVQYLMKNGGEI